ncbi:cytochrome c [Tamlana sp. 2_MG-2023]|uniref:c-type cytochrome n=1 Tax=unclassified Tamlana TaxID=2614803 RepID=UPI0026E28284|nr:MULTISPECIES: cytochrome c [unclassified Tamlana]MDO6760412.1 cytochrome c [Tamlana sp. 2_MG-2023]MDO6789889.1 cytochrome c [Tamlana sp. 1_MG-2023]
MKLLLLSIISITSCILFNIKPQDPLQESIDRGEVIYADFCVTCHLPNGAGVKNVYPPLAKSDYLMEKRNASIHLLKYGINEPIVVNNITYNGNMPAMGLDDDEIADVMNYITNAWGNTNKKMITEKEVSAIKK